MRSSARSIAAAAAGVVFVVSSLGGCAADPANSGAPATAAPPSLAPSATPPVDASTSVPPATFAPNGESITVQAIDNSFRPDPLEIAAGTEVVFENRGRNDHNVLPKGDPTAAAWGVQKELFAPGARYAHLFDAPGTYAYYCSIHGTDEIGMVGTIVVTAP